MVPIVPQHISPERTYEGRITEVYKRITPDSPRLSGQSGQTGDDTAFTYSAIGVDTPDKIVIEDAKPFRRIISSDLSDRPQIKAASINDPCRIDLSNGHPRLIDVLEQYIVADCQPSTTPTIPS